MTENRWQRTDDREQMTENRLQRTEIRGQITEVRIQRQEKGMSFNFISVFCPPASVYHFVISFSNSEIRIPPSEFVRLLSSDFRPLTSVLGFLQFCANHRRQIYHPMGIPGLIVIPGKHFHHVVDNVGGGRIHGGGQG